MGPPAIDPSGMIFLNFWPSTVSTSLVPIPSVAESHIQKTEPGPPMAIAVHTPAIFPLPIMAARDVVNVWKGVISPLLFLALSPYSFLVMRRKENPSRLSCTKRMRMERYRPAPKSRIRVCGPQTMSAIKRISRFIVSIFYLPGFSFYAGVRFLCVPVYAALKSNKLAEGRKLSQTGEYFPEKEKQLHTQLFLSAGTGEKKRITSHP